MKPLLLLIFLTSLHVLQASPPAHHHGDADAPKPRGTQAIDIASSADTLHLLTAEFDGHSASPKLLYLQSSNAGETWNAPIQVGLNQPPAHAAHRGMDPQIAASGPNLIAGWMTPGTDMFGGGPMATALSSDNGKTWISGPNPADDGSTEGHGFLDIAADANGHFHLVWLDNRAGKRGLRYAKSTDQGKTWSANHTVDAETCECCWNTIAISGNDLAILYRDKDPRDMSLIISRDLGKTWEPSKPLGKFAWDFNGCPHVGGSLSFNGSHWHAAIWTGKAPETGVHYLHSDDAGQTWSKPLPFVESDSSMATHPSLAVSPAGNLFLANTLQSEAGLKIQSYAGDPSQNIWDKSKTISPSGSNASHPLVLHAGEHFHIFWTETAPHQPTIWRQFSVRTK